MNRRFHSAFALGLLSLLGGCAAVETGPSPRTVTSGFAAVTVEPLPPVCSASLRGLCVVDELVVWASGTGGTVIRSVDGGRSWTDVSVGRSVAAAAEQDLRDIEAFDANTAVAMAAGEPAAFYRTEDGGRSWQLVHSDDRSGIFFDAMTFLDARRGLAFSDPIDGRLVIARSDDGGRSWRDAVAGSRPVTLAEEAGFAASGTCMTSFGSRHAWIGLGGAHEQGRARVARSGDGGATWKMIETPLRSAEGAGVFSLAFFSTQDGVAVGGDYLNPDDRSSCAAFTRDGGLTWELTRHPPGGYRSAVTVAGRGPRRLLLACGPGGIDRSTDGRAWAAVATERGYHAIAASARSGSTVFAVGADGGMARIVITN